MHFKKVSHAFVLRALGNGFAVINTFLLVRFLATDEFGIFRLLNSLVIIVYEFSNLGLLQTLTRVAIDEFDKKNRSFIKTYLPAVRLIWVGQFLLTIVFVYLYVIFRAPSEITAHLYLFIGYIVVCGICYFWAHYWIHLLYATRRILHWFSFLALLNGLKCVGIVLLVGGFSMGFEGALLAHLGAFLLGTLYGFLFWKKSRKRLVQNTTDKTPVPFSARFHVVYGVAHFINVEVNHFMGELIVLFLNFIHYPPDVVGFTGLAISLLYMFINFIVVLANYFFPHLPQMDAQNNNKELIKTLHLQVQGSSLVTWLMILLFYLAAPVFFQAVLPDYQQAAMLFTAFYLVLSMKPFEYEFVNLTLTRKMNWLLVVKSLGQIILLLIGLIISHLLGILSPLRALLLASVTDLVSLGVVFILGAKKLNYNFWRKEYIVHISAAVILFYTAADFHLVQRFILCLGVMGIQLVINRSFLSYIISRYNGRR